MEAAHKKGSGTDSKVSGVRTLRYATGFRVLRPQEPAVGCNSETRELEGFSFTKMKEQLECS